MAQGDSMLLNMLTGLLEDAVKALQRIERKVEDQTIVFKNIQNKMDDLEKQFETEFSALSEKSIPEIQKVLVDEIEALGLQDLNELEISLDHILNKLQKSIQILTIQGIIKWIENLALPKMQQTVIQRVATQPSQTSSAQAAASTTQQATSSAPPSQQAASSAPLQAPIPGAPSSNEEEEKKGPHLIKPSSFFGS